MAVRRLTRKKKQARKDANYDAVSEIYARAKQRGSADYLVTNQESDPVVVQKILDLAAARRQRRGLTQNPDFRVKHLSRVAGIYTPEKSGRFKDSRGREYENRGGTVYRVGISQ